MVEKSKPTPEDLQEMGRSLRAARKARGWNLRDAAQILQMSYGYLSQLERGLRVPRISTLVNLANRYHHDPAPWIRLAHPEVEVFISETKEAPRAEEWRAPGRLYRNAINDPLLKWPHALTDPDVKVSEEAKTYIARLYAAMWDLNLTPDRVEEIFPIAINDRDVDPDGWLANSSDVDYAVKRAVVEMYIKYVHERERVAARDEYGFPFAEDLRAATRKRARQRKNAHKDGRSDDVGEVEDE